MTVQMPGVTAGARPGPFAMDIRDCMPAKDAPAPSVTLAESRMLEAVPGRRATLLARSADS